MEMIIKNFENKYQSQVVELIAHIQRNEFNVDITSDQQPDLKDIFQFYQTGKGNFWIALDDDQVVGTIALLDIGCKEGALRKMFVHKTHRGKEKGTAKKLLDALLAWATKHQVDRIYLGTTPIFLAAHRFYEKNGFLEISQNELPQSFPVMEVDKKFYRYDVQPPLLEKGEAKGYTSTELRKDPSDKWSVALLEILDSPRHYHKVEKEIFVVVNGKLKVEVDGVQTSLSPGETIEILPGKIHRLRSADSTPARVFCFNFPSFDPNDFYLCQ